ncbi:peptidyl-prolyl cis-trans isomerase CYP21-4-like isoform X1 [Gossypium australe]|uniref:Peptidyl-prolyl cis-trans isomerase n=1 Tax=Gossypium australe TaxID=47621 RepID=A0A5B6WTK6_9ROSI|nr:peptidyl-prolyl cis-trans isomerase CYP21-4-like isoform X1 [Gossypium australe]
MKSFKLLLPTSSNSVDFKENGGLELKVNFDGKNKASGVVNSKQKEERANSDQCYYNSFLQFNRFIDFVVLNYYVQALVSKNVDEIADSKKYDLPGYAVSFSHGVLNTSKGNITIELFKDGSPEIVDKFLDLWFLCYLDSGASASQKGHFKGMPFHHVIKNYVILGGHSQDSGGIEDWTSKRKFHRRLPTSPKHEAFMLGTTKIKEDSKAFQLFITTAPILDSNDKLYMFGRVIKGVDVVQEIEEVDTDTHYRPKSPVGIINVILQQEI